MTVSVPGALDRDAPFYLDRDAPFYVAGHRGLVGSAVVRRLVASGFSRIVVRGSDELDLRDREATFSFFAAVRPRAVVLAAGKVGGIRANATEPVAFMSDNVRIQANVLDAALASGTERLLFLGSSCIYPRLTPQPITENALLTGHLESTNEAYAAAKIAGIFHVRAVRHQYGLPWISAMPTNLYGPHDEFSAARAHVLPSLIRRYEEAARVGATRVTNWGSGTPRREFLYVDDLADACLHLLEHYDGEQSVNVGVGADITIRELATAVADAVGYRGETAWDTDEPDGTPRKLLDVSLLAGLGWRARTSLEEGLRRTVAWYREHAIPVGA